MLLHTTASVKLFPGQYYDAETELNYNYFRSYNPATGRYLRVDPIGLEGDLNLYGYARQNPLLYVDHLGLEPGFKCFQQMLTGETSFADCYKEEGIKKKITETANAAECDLKCAATCTVRFLSGEVRDQAIQASAKQAAKRMANELVKKWLLRGIPIAGHTSTAISTYRIVKCTYSCWAN